MIDSNLFESTIIDYIPEIGTRNLTVSALRIRYRDNATTWWHQNISRVSQLHVTDVILHLQWEKKEKVFF